ncbi:hypothetical protein B296_00005565 [Ensete ventricosum]|uniref:Uncharacterized protein n=1 Tax=Ensete ventricosum TaxID=4639 RepID=A0A426Z022_ENSVE|nr:hypothetical protein B296_00005565 [Ensete ventricosum]
MQEDDGAHCALLRDGLQIGMTALSFDSREIAMGDRWLSLEKLSDGYGFSEKGLLRRREKKKKKGQAVGVLGAIPMLYFVGKQRSQFEKSTGRSSVKCFGQIASADNRPLLRRRGGRGGRETESLGCGIGETTQAINANQARQNRCGASVLLYKLMVPSSGPDRSNGRRDDAGRSMQISLVLSVEERRSWTASSTKVVAGGSIRLRSSSRGPQLRLKKRRELSFDSTIACSRVQWDLMP